MKYFTVHVESLEKAEDVEPEERDRDQVELRGAEHLDRAVLLEDLAAGGRGRKRKQNPCRLESLHGRKANSDAREEKRGASALGTDAPRSFLLPFLAAAISRQS